MSHDSQEPTKDPIKEPLPSLALEYTSPPATPSSSSSPPSLSDSFSDVVSLASVQGRRDPGLIATTEDGWVVSYNCPRNRFGHRKMWGRGEDQT